MSLYGTLADKLTAGRVVVIDGGTGTEIQRRGVPMDAETWCAEANLSHADVVRQVHEDYIAAGAEAIIANTFATSPLLFDHLGRVAEIAPLDKTAVRIAREAAQDRVPVAGSFSTMRPVVKGRDRTARQKEWPEHRARELMKRKAESLLEAGIDFIAMEMMRDLDYSLWATEAAVATGLPVWVGVSVERAENGHLHGFGRPDYDLDRIVEPLMATGAEVFTIMHSSPNDTSDALPLARAHWTGVVGCYPESGYFTMPDWQFVDVIPPDELVRLARSWTAGGARIVGGCCGIGPEHIRSLSEAFREKAT